MDLTLEKAIQVLNRRRHRDSSEWEVVPKLRANTRYVRKDGWATSTGWLTEFEALAIAEAYLGLEATKADGALGELQIFLCRGGGVENIGVYHDAGGFTLMLAGNDDRAAKLREIAREQIRQGIMSDFRLCRFVNAEEVEVIGKDWKSVE